MVYNKNIREFEVCKLIYFLDENPKLSASFLADKYISPLLCNSCTALSAVLSHEGFDIPQKVGYRHPLVNWALESKDNFEWLVSYAQGLSEVFKSRRGKIHRTTLKLYDLPNLELPSLGITPFPQMIPDKYKSDEPIKSYRNYYSNEKAKTTDYTNSKIPYWFIDCLEDGKKVLWVSYIEDKQYYLRLFSTSEGIVLQKKIKCSWVDIDIFTNDKYLVIERLLKNAN